MEQARKTPAPLFGLALLAERDPQVGKLVQDAIGRQRSHYGFLHTWPRRASISSAAAGPQVPAA